VEFSKTPQRGLAEPCLSGRDKSHVIVEADGEEISIVVDMLLELS
jgi:hypothetical protein